MKWDLTSDEGLYAALCFFEAEHDPELAQQLAEYFNRRLKNADVVPIQEPLFILYFRTVMGACVTTQTSHLGSVVVHRLASPTLESLPLGEASLFQG